MKKFKRRRILANYKGILGKAKYILLDNSLVMIEEINKKESKLENCNSEIGGIVCLQYMIILKKNLQTEYYNT